MICVLISPTSSAIYHSHMFEPKEIAREPSWCLASQEFKKQNSTNRQCEGIFGEFKKQNSIHSPHASWNVHSVAVSPWCRQTAYSRSGGCGQRHLSQTSSNQLPATVELLITWCSTFSGSKLNFSPSVHGGVCFCSTLKHLRRIDWLEPNCAHQV